MRVAAIGATMGNLGVWLAGECGGSGVGEDGDVRGIVCGITYIGMRKSELYRRYAVMQMYGMPNIIRGV